MPGSKRAEKGNRRLVWLWTSIAPSVTPIDLCLSRERACDCSFVDSLIEPNALDKVAETCTIECSRVPCISFLSFHLNDPGLETIWTWVKALTKLDERLLYRSIKLCVCRLESPAR